MNDKPNGDETGQELEPLNTGTAGVSAQREHDRRAANREDDWAGFAAGYRERLVLAREEIERLVQLIASERVCLLCFAAGPETCHRSLLANEIQGLLDVSTVHLRPGRAVETLLEVVVG
jgi:hypothetical protein